MIDSPLLEKCAGYIGGRWVGAKSGQTFAVSNPATGDHLADVPVMADGETVAAIEAAVAALRKILSPEQRSTWLLSVGQKLLEHKQELARIVTLENGKPLKESLVEVEYAAGFFSYYSQQLSHLDPEALPKPVRNCRWMMHHRPAGVVGLITPWNFPLAMLAKKLAPAIAAGCSVVVKPARLTPLSTIALWALADSAGLPPGQLNLVIGQAGPIGETLCKHPEVRVISFTGSTKVGKTLALNAANHVKRLSLELGGNAPFIVCEDSDVDVAANALLVNKFRASGQTCVCANRVYAHRSIAEPFTDAVSSRVKELQVGDGLDPATDVGPLINRVAFDKVAEHVRDALAGGAQRIVGEDPPRPKHDWGCFYPPTVLTGVQTQMMLCRDETFGPVVGISVFNTEEAVVTEANSTQYGLAAYLFTQDSDRADRMIRQLHFGHVGFNTGTGPAPEAPFGGMKQSGFGREGGLEGLFEFCETQTVVRP